MRMFLFPGLLSAPRPTTYGGRLPRGSRKVATPHFGFVQEFKAGKAIKALRDSVRKIGVFTNKTVFAGIAAIIALQAIFIYAPFMHAIFDSAPLAPGDVLASILVGAVILPVVGLEKWWRRRRTVAEKHGSHMQRDQQ